ncbi:DEAD/DEAH box helicase family protein [uncultured Dysosmobacter sp.]|uniref:DEAD/DEAH box helicase family protein n=1 Tax=uncultured Dysosmobacter sp. TaxID=2591384 RepID=UPI0026149171|nr:DEAD/DEAH box helicase family protein [uncultured Dysosmobacter sp.]
MVKKEARQAPFDDQLVLFRYFLHELRLDSLSALSEKLNSTELEGVDESGNTFFCNHIALVCRMKGSAVTAEKLRLYDENIRRHTRQISEKRGALRWKYFQYVALLFTEMYLDRYFTDAEAFCGDLNAWLAEIRKSSLGLIDFEPYTSEKLNKLAFMCATGSGKTLLMHMNILQYLHYFKRARRLNSRLAINKVIVLAPNEGMSSQHLEELALSSISAALFEKDFGITARSSDVIVIDMNKLKEEGKVKTVSVDSFGQNNLVLVDEGHRGLSGNAWYDYRTRLSADGFAFEYSATFKQALRSNSKKDEERALMEEYGKSILMDYSYKYFYGDGYGKDYRIYNLRSGIDRTQLHLYMVGCLLTFYQQLKLFDEKQDELQAFLIEKPLLVFVGNRVTAKTSKDELTDMEEILEFLDRFVRDRAAAIHDIRAVLEDETGLIDSSNNELFFQDFEALKEFFGNAPDPAAIFADILRLVFNAGGNVDEPRLHMENLRQVPGEIGLKIGGYGEYFGVISVGDTDGLIKNCEKRGIAAKTEEFVSASLFRAINAKDSNIKVLLGSRKFTEGWNSWRVSTMGLINFAKGEGSQAIQLFGRGVRLKGYNGCLKRSRRLDVHANAPRHIELLETLSIFGVRAQYMEDFKSYLECEGAPVNDGIRNFDLPVVSRPVKDRTLYVIKVRNGASFKKQARRLVLDKPDAGFLQYLLRNKTTIDCRSRIQTIDSSFRFELRSVPDVLTIPDEMLPLLDHRRIFEELEQYKSEKRYFNISILPNKLMEILRTAGWYGLLIPREHLRIDSLAKLEAATDYAIMALKSYMDKFFKYEKERWEAPLLEYAPLNINDRNFLGTYHITYTRQHPWDTTGDALGTFLEETSATLRASNGLGAYKKEALRGRMVLLDCKPHLYAPLICLEKSDPQIQVSPDVLNRGEMLFMDRLNAYTDSHSDELKETPLYLLRNQSRTGIGFFEAGNFYPDFILWIDTAKVQYISFIDPKGLVYVNPDHCKVEFCKTIKDLEARLSPPAGGKRIVLNSFIMSATPSSLLHSQWAMDQAQLEEKNVYALDDPSCVERMIRKILGQV